MFIDIHAHAYRIPYLRPAGQKPWPTPAQLIAYYDTLGVEKAVLLPLIGPECYLPQSNEDILEAAAAFPGRFIPFCNIHPQAMRNDPSAPLEEMLELYKEAGCKGIGEVTCNFSFFDPFLCNLFRAVEKVGLPLTFHLAHRAGAAYGIVDEPGLPGLDETLSRYPGITFLGHSAPFWAEIGPLTAPYRRSGYPREPIATPGVLPDLMRRHPNLYGDLSAGSGANALMRDPEHAIRFLNEFQDRLCFGIDICSPPEERHGELARFLLGLRERGEISPAVFGKVARDNAIRILSL